jgi:DNA repair protein RadC
MGAIRVTTHRYSFQVVREQEPAYPTGAGVTTPHDAAAIAQHVIGGQISEVVLALFLDARHRVTGYAEIVRGTLNAARLTPRDILVPALAVNAAALVVAHCHPSGELSPSRADRQVTVVLRQACELIGVPLLDHLIVTEDAVFSFRESERWGE